MVGWQKLSDLCISSDNLVGCSFAQSCVSVWVVDLKNVRPYHSGPDEFEAVGYAHSSRLLRSQLVLRVEDVLPFYRSTPWRLCLWDWEKRLTLSCRWRVCRRGTTAEASRTTSPDHVEVRSMSTGSGAATAARSASEKRPPRYVNKRLHQEQIGESFVCGGVGAWDSVEDKKARTDIVVDGLG